MAILARYTSYDLRQGSSRKRRRVEPAKWNGFSHHIDTNAKPNVVFSSGKDDDDDDGNAKYGKVKVKVSQWKNSSSSDCSPSEIDDHRNGRKLQARTSRNVSPPWRSDDKDGHYVFELGENLTSRYKIISKLGQGTFGQALECCDRKAKDFVVIKVVRAIQKYRDAAKIEIDALREVAKHGKEGRRCVQMRGTFEYRNHTCIVFEKLGPSLYDALQNNNYHPFPIDLIRDVARQILEAVAYIHSRKLVHTDLKPENILFVTSEFKDVVKKGSKRKFQDILRVPKCSSIKIIDFGSTTFEYQDHNCIVSTRHYRAPEVILGLGWNFPCDIWSVGCILIELMMGQTLFQTHDNLEHLAMMERVLGSLPTHMIKKADKRYEKYFRHGRKLDWPEGASSRDSVRVVKNMATLEDLVKTHVDGSATYFTGLLRGLLKYDPVDRLTAEAALKHSFFLGCH